jgi:phosphatidylserine/phosphatidylglycerophosphate/cardiolipin synthase-like enzyme
MRPWLLAMLVLLLPFGASGAPIPATGTVNVAFSPHGGGTELVVNAIHGARKQILVQAYSFTSPSIAKALVEAKRRGADVRVVLDKSQETEKYSGATYLTNNGIPVWIDRQHAIAHNKVMVIDGSTVVTGSFNFTKAAEENNAENVLVLSGDSPLAALYRQNWQLHQQHSEPYRLAAQTDGQNGPRNPRLNTSRVALSGPVIGNTRSHVYHFAGCPGYVRAEQSQHKTYFTSREAADMAGYRPERGCP